MRIGTFRFRYASRRSSTVTRGLPQVSVRRRPHNFLILFLSYLVRMPFGFGLNPKDYFLLLARSCFSSSMSSARLIPLSSWRIRGLRRSAACGPREISVPGCTGGNSKANSIARLSRASCSAISSSNLRIRLSRSSRSRVVADVAAFHNFDSSLSLSGWIVHA